MRSDEQLYNLLVTSKCYIDTVDKFDKAKVAKHRQGLSTRTPGSKIGIVAWELGYRAWQEEQVPDEPPVPPPPPPVEPHFGIAPRTYNYAPGNNSDPRFCVHGIPGVNKGDDGRWHDIYSRYDDDGRDVDGGRTRFTQVSGLRQADNSDGRGECELYDGLTAWPDGSYGR